MIALIALASTAIIVLAGGLYLALSMEEPGLIADRTSE